MCDSIKMALRALPHDVRSMLCASAQINNYKTVVEELVYNALDAESTSIAIRVHIPDNRMQVIDNGCGILKNDFNSLGQRYMTSKLTDITTLKSIPKFYGYRGEFLANVLVISQSVKIISRHKDDEKTLTLAFIRGKRGQVIEMTKRPSKGTTVEIKGFLYNLNIQNRGIDPINELQNIKAFLEQLSILNSDISLSLRDDSTNEIVFQMHKQRNIYQTLLTLFDINKIDVKELQIEKNQYKILAFIGTTDTSSGRHWVYVNRRFIANSSKLHATINDSLKKYSVSNTIMKIKYMNQEKNEEHLFKSNIPFYFILITCPYIDYDLAFASCQLIIEFKDWAQINKILEKLIKFYVGDIKLKEIKVPNNANVVNIDSLNNLKKGRTQGQIKKIVHKILGNTSKKIWISQLHNGIKGKLITRKKRKKNREVSCHNVKVKLDNELNSCNAIKNVNLSNEDIVNFKNNCNENNMKTKFKKYNHKQNSRGSNQNNINEKDSISKNSNKTYNIKNKKKKKNRNNMIDMSIPKPDLLHNTSLMKNIQSKTKLNKSKKRKPNNRKVRKYRCMEKIDVGPKKYEIQTQSRMPYNYEANRLDDAVDELSMNNPYYERNKIPRSLKMKTYAIDYIKHKVNVNPFKTTYDLVQTIFDSQQERRYNYEVDSYNIPNKNNINTDHEQVSYRFPIKRLPIEKKLSKDIDIDYTRDNRPIFERKMPWDEINNIIPGYFVSCDLSCANTYSTHPHNQSNTKQAYYFYNSESQLVPQSLGIADVFKETTDETCIQNCQSIHYTNGQTMTKLTYDSHVYNKNYYENIYSDRRQETKDQNLRFISKHSKDNFVTSDSNSLYKNNFRNNTERTVKRTQCYSNFARHMLEDTENIEFTSNSETNKMFIRKQNKLLQAYGQKYKNNFSKVSKDVGKKINHNSYLPASQSFVNFGNTYTIVPSCSISSEYCDSHNINRNITTEHTNYTVTHEVYVTNLVHRQNIGRNNIIAANEKHDSKDETEIINNFNISNEELSINDNIQPINLCETVLDEHTSIENEFALSFKHASRLNNSLYNNIDTNNENLERIPSQIIQTVQTDNIDENVSHHFSNILYSNHFNAINDIDVHAPVPTEISIIDKIQNIVKNNTQNIEGNKTDYSEIAVKELCVIGNNNFDFKDRFRFLPKGMSQIFEKSGSKVMCDYNLDQDYYEDTMYNDFAEDVHMQTEIYEPMVQNVENFSTKHIQKFKTKVKKDNTSLIFDEKSLKEILVLNQVDNKFIASIMKGTERGLEDTREYLILFDQHAVHERIKLETNLGSYFIEDRWKRVPLNDITLKLSKDEILYLHNYKDKFNQLGLQWTILDSDEVSINSIPEAILGKNPREVDKVITAVKNLIIEEINVIKLQKGCISLYPKSIMDLVFSEACRYAIKFGDKLSRSDCIELLNDLSNCKTPFQCAHGRPVMAVLFEIKSDKRDYKINTSSLETFVLNKK